MYSMPLQYAKRLQKEVTDIFVADVHHPHNIVTDVVDWGITEKSSFMILRTLQRLKSQRGLKGNKETTEILQLFVKIWNICRQNAACIFWELCKL